MVSSTVDGDNAWYSNWCCVCSTWFESYNGFEALVSSVALSNRPEDRVAEPTVQLLVIFLYSFQKGKRVGSYFRWRKGLAGGGAGRYVVFLSFP